MFTEQILKSILSLKSFSSTGRSHVPALEGIHISVDAETKTITALATDRYAAARMIISVPEYDGESWSRNVSIATLNAALATVKASGQSVSFFPESYMPEFPVNVAKVIDKFVNSDDATEHDAFNAKYLGALAKINVGGDKSGRWEVRMVDQNGRTGLAATATYGSYEAAVIAMPLNRR